MAVVALTANYHSAPLIPGQRKTYVRHKKGTPNITNFPISENTKGQEKLHKQMNIRAEENLCHNGKCSGSVGDGSPPDTAHRALCKIVSRPVYVTFGAVESHRHTAAVFWVLGGEGFRIPALGLGLNQGEIYLRIQIDLYGVQ